jgi:hypothetical protein
MCQNRLFGAMLQDCNLSLEAAMDKACTLKRHEFMKPQNQPGGDGKSAKCAEVF